MIRQIVKKQVKTTTVHRCFCCYGVFIVGSDMISQTCVNDNGIYTIWSCLTCDTLTTEFEAKFIDADELEFSQECVREVMTGYDVDTPEELLIALRAEKKQTSPDQNKGQFKN